MALKRTSEYNLFGGYRVYLTPETWIITYLDKDFIILNRLQEHSSGFLLMLVETLFSLLKGVRSDLRDNWAVFSESYDRDAEMLWLKVRAADNKVLEISIDPKLKTKVQGE